MPEKYQHLQLDLKSPTFRLLCLHPADEQDGYDLRCDIIEASFDENQGFNELLPYEALSYTWGSEDHSDHILVGNRILPITKNLREALLSLRGNTDRWLWIDAICINQDDNAEKGHQVRQMGHIYEQAEGVVVWLGTSNLHTATVMECLKEVEASLTPVPLRVSESQFDSHWTLARKSGMLYRVLGQSMWDQMLSEAALNSNVFSEFLSCGIEDLLGRRWFRRVWIIQEVSSAKRVLVQCGSTAVLGRIFIHAARISTSATDKHVGKILQLLRGSRVRPDWFHDRGLESLLEHFAEANATEERDRIFALLHMCDIQRHKHVNFSIEELIDYDADPTEVIRKTIIFMFPLPQDLPPLQFVSFSTFFVALSSGYLKPWLLQLLWSHSKIDESFEFLQYCGRLPILLDTFVIAGGHPSRASELIQTLKKYCSGTTIPGLTTAFSRQMFQAVDFISKTINRGMRHKIPRSRGSILSVTSGESEFLSAAVSGFNRDSRNPKRASHSETVVECPHTALASQSLSHRSLGWIIGLFIAVGISILPPGHGHKGMRRDLIALSGFINDWEIPPDTNLRIRDWEQERSQVLWDEIIRLLAPTRFGILITGGIWRP